ncbi:hypothetical protein SAMN04488519_107258 [Algoriphagus ornithinivorans]|uniref:Lipocalin-like domain-containing protein n=1 Tax=Algoriphagus ornithinivorans TaxID=226506 RepID=A0A1I5HTT0_9BACT|nr:hypothetical protein [Algoriphagus ornithinivorans]SFO51673.1 hypothetical protein SAMN04488519_107258 [Algoriphagus ornithinivorans]
MKKSLFSLSLISLFTVIIFACGDKPAPTPQKTPEQLAVEALTGSGSQTWGIAGGGSVTRSGSTVTDQYQNFELILNSGSAKTYTTRNNNDLFDNSGNWSFAGTNFDKFSLTGAKPAAGREISFTRTGDNLRLEFNIPAPGARINGTFAVAGSYVFNLVKK